MFGLNMFAVRPFATRYNDEQLFTGIVWQDRCPFEPLWVNQDVAAAVTKPCTTNK